MPKRRNVDRMTWVEDIAFQGSTPTFHPSDHPEVEVWWPTVHRGRISRTTLTFRSGRHEVAVIEGRSRTVLLHGFVEADWNDYRHRYVRVRWDDGSRTIFTSDDHPSSPAISDLLWQQPQTERETA